MWNQMKNRSILTNSQKVNEYTNGLDLDAIIACLQEHVFDTWFSRILDEEYGGFLTDFDSSWQPSGPQDKMLEPQARQTRVAARGALFDSSRLDLKQAAEHGFRFLKDVMWDPEYGGWYRMVDRQGQPLESSSKHGHGIAYAISACVTYFRLTQDPDALNLAKEGFQWLERYGHDNQYGGYFVYFLQDGTIIRTQEQNPTSALTDPLGNPLGFKDANTTCDMLEALADLHRVWPDPLVKQRIGELLTIVRDRVSIPSGAMHFAFYPNWIPSPHLVIYGHGLQGASQVLKAAHEIGLEQGTQSFAQQLVDHALLVAWDKINGGFYFAGSATGPIYMDGHTVFVKDKSWWVQAEGLRSLLVLALLQPSAQNIYMESFQTQWAYIQKHIIDSEHGGWRRFGTDCKLNSQASKADIWKDSFHEGRALINVIQMLQTGQPVCD